MDRRAMRLLRAAKRRLRSSRAAPAVPREADQRLDGWLRPFDEELSRIDAACRPGGAERFALFRDLDPDLWALLLTKQYDGYSNIRNALPDVPDASLQELWNGLSGVGLARQSLAFYTRLRERYARHSRVPLEDAQVLDFGCGWGRLTRFLARDVQPGNLFGCDPVEQILAHCRENRVPATLARSAFVPARLPFDVRFDLVYAFSVFTHVSEKTHLACLRALHASLEPGGILIVTVRPVEYMALSPLMAPLTLDPDTVATNAKFLFVPHPAEPSHLQYEGGEMTYGEAVITLPYVEERWSEWFELLAVDVQLEDLYQVVITLRRR
jgi:SAM-dependent methyltransferase